MIRFRFSDATWQTYADPRVAAIVAAVPYAADFDMNSLAAPRVPLGLVTARLDAWLVPRFHGDAVLKACAACETVADIRDGGHGALLSPLPPGLTGLVGELLNDPPGFNRAALPEVDRKIAAFSPGPASVAGLPAALRCDARARSPHPPPSPPEGERSRVRGARPPNALSSQTAVHVDQARRDHLEALHVLVEDLLLVHVEQDGDWGVLDDRLHRVLVVLLALLEVGLRPGDLDRRSKSLFTHLPAFHASVEWSSG